MPIFVGIFAYNGPGILWAALAQWSSPEKVDAASAADCWLV